MKAVQDSLIYLGGELISKSIPFLLLPYLSRKLGVEGYGELSYYQTYLVLFLILVSLSQDGAVARYFYFYGKRSLNVIVHTGYFYTLIVGGIILAVCWLLQAEIIAYLAVSAIFQSFLAVQLSVRQCQKQALQYMIIQSLTSFTSIFLTVVMLEFYQTDLVEKRILAILFGNLMVFCLVYFFYVGKVTSNKHYSLRQYQLSLVYILTFGLPLLLNQAGFYLKGQLDRIFIFHKFSQADLGLYAMGAQIASVLMILLLALHKATQPYFYEGLKNKTITLSKVHQWAFCAFILSPIPALFVWIMPEQLFIWLLGEQFFGTKYFIVLFLFSTALTAPYLILTNYLFFYGKNKMISFASVLSSLVYVVSLYVLANTEIEYVPYASIIAGLVFLPLLYSMTKKVIV
ncbi:Lsg locus protein 1 [[Haemophilus] ducreyi]|uniref:Lsg locus protein 1 n=2 Tax=Haemophilus ducreyi TaxID=730 RepID=A0AAC8UC22_HAEDC|nr:oligosaccharide flippase family protein [[Haemophilus] ducreyi]AAP95768.1 conserved putative lipopolysaccharide biosynthesis protein [[Haemophilus] ducreyi 35000HP]AKO30821.1 Lsg locus protein 1 [[Haemophilus] ducreyi]AKO32259.1 Lsg locus protein 1 [[Haemophilus] ducreyi]AKO33713.1 Lsg locus protein 1 [[Haemophilus] ducreyi]AKO35160.1 Lsg locus protein 1 [[Haemophilus] ducreyi]